MRSARPSRARTCAGTARRSPSFRSSATASSAACRSRMRLALLVLVGCAGQPRIVEPIDPPALPPIATFRWALSPLACDEGGRSTIDTCEHSERLESELVAVYAPSDDTSLLVAIRYEGAIGAPLRWQ